MEKCLDKFQFQKLTIIYVSLVSVVVSWPLKIKEKLFIFDEEKVGGVVYVIKFQGLKLCFLAISLYIWCLISFPLWPTVAHSNKMCWGQATGTPTQGGPGQDRRSGVRSGQRSLVSTKPLLRSLKFNVRRGKNRARLAIDVLCSIKATHSLALAYFFWTSLILGSRSISLIRAKSSSFCFSLRWRYERLIVRCARGNSEMDHIADDYKLHERRQIINHVGNWVFHCIIQIPARIWSISILGF